MSEAIVACCLGGAAALLVVSIVLTFFPSLVSGAEKTRPPRRTGREALKELIRRENAKSKAKGKTLVPAHPDE